MVKKRVQYSKYCLICQKEFLAFKISALFCSKKCQNQSRYLPEMTLKKLIERNNRFMLKASTFINSIPEERFSGYNPDGATSNNPLGKDEGLLIARAREVAEQRGIKVPSGTTLEEITKDIDKKDKEVLEDNLQYINQNDPIGDSEGFGVSSGDNQEEIDKKVQEINNKERHQKGLGIRRLGE